VVLCWQDGKALRPSHFRMREFESGDGLVVIDPCLIQSLERVRYQLGARLGVEVEVIITSGTRTETENERLAARLGWVEHGGPVARDSRHLPKYGGIAVDLYVRYRRGDAWAVVPQAEVADACRQHFVFVKADYEDGHVHADNRKE